ncbi:MAG: FAD-dependent oxidoreductase, partial [Nitrososphaera sp.]|nr:FAD-dependent oxidoreductase [Nitrososphaera sp.]
LKRDYDPDNKLGYQSCHANPDDDLEASEGVGVNKADYFRAEFGPMRIETRHQPLLKGLLDICGISEGNPDVPKWNDLVAFPSYAAEDPDEPKFTLTGEEGDQGTLLDLLLLALRRVCELLQFKEGSDLHTLECDPVWEKNVTRKSWSNFRKASSVHRHYWQGYLRDWINELEDADYDNIRRKAVVDGVSLWNMGFWNLLSDVLSPMAVVKLRDWASFYHLLPENPNAAEWLVFWLRAMKSGDLRGIRGGMYRLIWKFVKVLEKCTNIAIQRNAKLVKLTKSGNDRVCLTFEDPTHDTSVERVILAVPKRPLELLNLPDTLKDKGASDTHVKQLKKHLNAVFGFPLLKCFFILHQPWWEDNRPLNRYASSIPTREIKYDKSKDKTKGMVMVYTDRPATQFWADYLVDKYEQHKAEVWLSHEANPRLWKRFVQYARDYEHHDFTKDRLLACGMRDWGKDPYGGACHSWRPGAKSWEAIDYLRAFSLDGREENKENKNIHICGEAYSDYQGFIEGALRSAEKVIDAIS